MAERGPTARRTIPAFAAAGAIGLIMLFASGPGAPPAAQGASCQTVQMSGVSDTLTFQGGDCSILSEQFVFACIGGETHVEYTILEPTGPPDDFDTNVPCSAALRFFARGNAGADVIDMSRVTPGNGFTGMAGKQNAMFGHAGADTLIGSAASDDIQGGTDGDTLRSRDGVADALDCDRGTDAAVTDRLSLDSVNNCESVDALAEPAKPKRCKKKHRKKKAAAAKKCKKKRRK